MKYLFFLFFIPMASTSYSQPAASIIGCYESKEDRFIYNSLYLNSDSTCFIYSSCECGDETFTKARWEISENSLNVVCLPDSSYSIYPKVDYVYSNSETDSVTIYFTDYYNQPIEGMLLAFTHGVTVFKPERIRFDQRGKVILSKQIYSGFMMEYEQYRYDRKKVDVIGHYFENEHKLTAIKFHSGFGQAGYDRELKQKNLGTFQYLMKDDGLYSEEGELIFKKCIE